MKNLLILVFSPAFIWVFYDLIFYVRPMSSSDDYGFNFYLILAFGFLAVLSLFVCFFHFKPPRKVIEVGGRRLAFCVYLVVFILVVVSYFFLLFSVFGNINPFNAFDNYDHFYTKNSEGTAWVFLIINILVFLLLYDVYRAGADWSRLLVILLCLMIVSLTGGRSIIIVQAMFLFFIVYVVRGKEFGASIMLGVLLFSSVVFLGNAVMRSGGMDSYLEGATQFDFDSSFILSDVSDYVEINGPSYLISITDFYNFFMPRYFNPDKPISTAETRLIYPDVAERGTNYTFGFYANALLNLGYAGVFLAPIFLLVYQYVYYSYCVRFRSSASGFFVLFFCFYSIQVVRGGVINSRFLIFILSISVACFIWSMLSTTLKPARRFVCSRQQVLDRVLLK